MDCIQIEYVRTDNAGKEWYKVIITSPTVPDNLEFDGSSVDHMPNGTGIAAGSVLLTPSANYVAYVDGVFGGPTPEGEGILSVAFSPDFGYDPLPSSRTPIYIRADEASVTDTFDYYADSSFSGETISVTVTPTSDWYVYDENDEVVGGKGEAVTLEYTANSNNLSAAFGVQDTEEWIEGETRTIQCNWSIVYGDI